ncbi:MAG: hypothetical protein AAB222_03715, partial [Candidatus Binatota bacterium]
DRLIPGLSFFYCFAGGTFLLAYLKTLFHKFVRTFSHHPITPVNRKLALGDVAVGVYRRILRVTRQEEILYKRS